MDKKKLYQLLDNYLCSATDTADTHDLLFLIPFLEVEVDPDLKQNPGY